MAGKQTLDSPAKKAKVISLILEGLSDAQVAAAISTPRRSVTRQAIHAFRKRHAADLQSVTAELVEATKSLWIQDMTERMRRRQELYEETDQRRRELPERAGMTYAAMVREQRSILDAAEPRDKGGVTVNIDNRRLVVYHNGERE